MLKQFIPLLILAACTTSKPVKEPVGMNAMQADRQQAREGIAPQEMPATEQPAPGTIVTPLDASPLATPP